MKLEEWIERSDVSVSEVARKLAVSRQTVHAWLRGEHMPNVHHMVLIFAVTEGSVTLHDFDFRGDQSDKADGVERQEDSRVERTTGSERTISPDSGHIRGARAGI